MASFISSFSNLDSGEQRKLVLVCLNAGGKEEEPQNSQGLEVCARTNKNTGAQALKGAYLLPPGKVVSHTEPPEENVSTQLPARVSPP